MASHEWHCTDWAWGVASSAAGGGDGGSVGGKGGKVAVSKRSSMDGVPVTADVGGSGMANRSGTLIWGSGNGGLAVSTGKGSGAKRELLDAGANAWAAGCGVSAWPVNNWPESTSGAGGSAIRLRSCMP